MKTSILEMQLMKGNANVVHFLLYKFDLKMIELPNKKFRLERLR